jgi:hypothetical protein
MTKRNNSFGQTVRELCFRREDDEALARGYPHFIALTDEPLDAKKAQKLAAKASHDERLATKLRVRFPRAAASQFVRGARAKEFQSWTKTGGPAPESAFADGSTVSPDEARELVAVSVKVAGCSSNANPSGLGATHFGGHAQTRSRCNPALSQMTTGYSSLSSSRSSLSRNPRARAFL